MYFLLTLAVFFLSQTKAKLPDIPDVTNGLNRNGENVCSFTEQVSKEVKVSYKQETLVTVWKEVCCWKVIGCWKWCNRSRLATKSYTQYQTVTKYFDRENYHCCSGWQREKADSTSCKKPVCNIDCRNGGECVSPDTCKCKKGFEGKYCQLDVNECASRNKCEQTCVNTDGGYYCACQRGYQLNDDKRTCSDMNECKQTNESSLYIKPPCSCKNDSHDCKAACINTPGSYKCKCGKGYRLNGAEQCEDINECIETRGLCDQGCVNTPGSYYCQCHKGYKHDGKSCKDINECATKNGGCSDTCHNLKGTHVCSCPDRFYLGEDRRTCKLINGTSLKRETFCESDLVGYLQCPNHDEKLAIIDVMYGRLSKDVCQTGDYQSNLRCVSTKGFNHLKECMDKNSCVFYFDDTLDDPCPGVEKYIEVVYDCLK